MKLALLISILIMVGVITVAAQFTLVAASYWDSDSKESRPSVFKIDTRTGQTWLFVLYVVTIPSGDHEQMVSAFGWMPVPEPLRTETNTISKR